MRAAIPIMTDPCTTNVTPLLKVVAACVRQQR